ncbi:type II toxin-antitoxin system TacA family antitoxin [Micromonospora sp. NPDC003197]
MSAKAERLHLRLDEHQKALLEAASQAAGDSVSTFVLKAATEAAADVLADRRIFLLDEDAWRVFDEALQRPAEEVSGLRELLADPTVLDPPASGAAR